MKPTIDRIWGAALFCLGSLLVVSAQQPVTEQSGEAQQRTMETTETKNLRYAVPLQVTQGAGRQPFLIKKKFFNLSLRETGTYTDNVFSLDTFKRGDFYNSLELGAGGSLTMFRNWTVSLRLGIRDFRYQRFGTLDFDSAFYSGTVNYNWKEWNAYGTVEHSDLYRRNFGDHFFQEDDGTLGLYWSHALGPRALMYLGGQYSRQWAHPESASKNLPTFYGGLITVPWEQLPKLRLTFAGSYSYADFIVSNRVDDRYNLGVDVSYEFYPWLTVGMGAGGSFGESNQKEFDFSSFSNSATLKMNYQF